MMHCALCFAVRCRGVAKLRIAPSSARLQVEHAVQCSAALKARRMPTLTVVHRGRPCPVQHAADISCSRLVIFAAKSSVLMKTTFRSVYNLEEVAQSQTVL